MNKYKITFTGVGITIAYSLLFAKNIRQAKKQWESSAKPHYTFIKIEEL